MQAYKMTHPQPSWADTLVESLIGRIGLVFATTLVVAASVPLLFFANALLSPLALRLAVALLLGLTGGITARILLPKSKTWLKFSVALLAVLAGMGLLHALTLGFAGFNLRQYFGLSKDGAIQLILAAAAVWMAVQAWKQPAPEKKSGMKKLAPKNNQKRPSIKVTAALQKATAKPLRSGKKSSIPKKDPFSARALLARGRLFWKNQLQKSGKTMRRVRVKVQKALAPSGAWAQTTLDKLRQGMRSSTQISSSSITIQRRRRQAPLPRPAPRKIIRLQGDEEHRCPYCLDTVEDNDPRGVKICPICGTYHHADCWAITGVCQVPHQHE